MGYLLDSDNPYIQITPIYIIQRGMGDYLRTLAELEAPSPLKKHAVNNGRTS